MNKLNTAQIQFFFLLVVLGESEKLLNKVNSQASQCQKITKYLVLTYDVFKRRVSY